jgi:hypothetical protein
MNKVMRASGFSKPGNFDQEAFWHNLANELDRVRCTVVGLNRIDPYSPNTYLAAFMSETPLSPSNTLNVIKENDLRRAKAMCVLLNSIVFFAQFFLLKEESTGRYMHIRFYDLYDMDLYPDDKLAANLANVFDTYSQMEFPSLREQLDTNFDHRYSGFWSRQRRRHASLFSVLGNAVDPSDIRLRLDLDVCKALGTELTPDDLIPVYRAIVEEMILTRGLTRD